MHPWDARQTASQHVLVDLDCHNQMHAAPNNHQLSLMAWSVPLVFMIAFCKAFSIECLQAVSQASVTLLHLLL